MELASILEGVTPYLPWAGMLMAILLPLVYRWQTGLWFPSRFSVAGLPPILSWLFAFIWLALFVTLTFGMAWVIVRLFNLTAAPTEDPADLRWHLLTLTAHTAALGAVVALPFTVLKANATERQTRAAEDQAQHNALVLFNENMNVTAKDLQARRQITIEIDGVEGSERYKDTWQDDIIMRCTAIDRLEGLATEKPDAAPRIARLLCVYLRELSRIITPDNSEHPRADMEKAAQTLGRLKTIRGVEPDLVEIDLRGANLSGFDLSELWFTEAQLEGANLVGANLSGAGMQNANLQSTTMMQAILDGADLNGADLKGAKMLQAEARNVDLARVELNGDTTLPAVLEGSRVRHADLSQTHLSQENLDEMFGDKDTVILPKDRAFPAHWPDDTQGALGEARYTEALNAWRRRPASTSYTSPENPA